MSPVDAFVEAGKRHPDAAIYWIDKIIGLSENDIAILLAEVPLDRLSLVSRQFASELIAYNRGRIAAVRDIL